MGDIGKTFIAIGALLVMLGVLFSLLGKIPGAGKLPGDILIRRENFTFYFPLATCLLLSLLLSLLIYFFNRR